MEAAGGGNIEAEMTADQGGSVALRRRDGSTVSVLLRPSSLPPDSPPPTASAAVQRCGGWSGP